MKRKNTMRTGRILALLFTCLILSLAFAVPAHALDKKVTLGSWTKITVGKNRQTGKLSFSLPQDSSVKVQIRNCKTTTDEDSYAGLQYDLGNVTLYLDSTSYHQLFHELNDTERLFATENEKTVTKLDAGSHYISYDAENVVSFEVRVSVSKKYPKADYSAYNMDRTVKTGKWFLFKHGPGFSNGYLRFKLEKPSDIKVSIKNVTGAVSYGYDDNEEKHANISAYLDNTTALGDKTLMSYESGYGTVISSESYKFSELDAGSHYIYFSFQDIDTFSIKITVTKTYKTGPATAIRLPSKETMSVGTTLKLEPALVNSHEKLTGFKWSSSKKKVATVSSKGVVKAKKAGTAVITCKLKNGKKYKCKIKVKKNEKKKSATFSGLKYGDVDIDWTKISVKGKTLTMKCKCYNNHFFYHADKYDWITITLFTNDYKVIAKKTFKNVKLGLGPYGMKNLTFKFKLKYKNFDIHKDGVRLDQGYVYTYSY